MASTSRDCMTVGGTSTYSRSGDKNTLPSSLSSRSDVGVTKDVLTVAPLLPNDNNDDFSCCLDVCQNIFSSSPILFDSTSLGSELLDFLTIGLTLCTSAGLIKTSSAILTALKVQLWGLGSTSGFFHWERGNEDSRFDLEALDCTSSLLFIATDDDLKEVFFRVSRSNVFCGSFGLWLTCAFPLLAGTEGPYSYQRTIIYYGINGVKFHY